MTPDDISIGQLVEQIAVVRSDRGEALPLRDERPWHELFYHLKTQQDPARPKFFDSLDFDWDGPYPKSQDLSAFLQALHWNACVSAANPHFEQASLNPEVKGLWGREAGELAEELEIYIRRAAQGLDA